MSYGNKPNEIRHPQAALLIEDYVCQRIQSLGYTADLNSEEVNQLTDPNVVEVVDSDPTVSLTIDINEFGSINTYNQLVGFHAFPTSAGGASAGYSFTEDTIDNTNHRDGTVSHTDFGEIATDFLVAIKESASATTQARALWFNNCFIDSLSGTYQVDGFASESISLTGSQQRWFLNNYAGAQLGVGTMVTGASGHIDVTHGTDGEVIYVTENGVILNNSYWGEEVGTLDITSEGGYNFSNTARYRYIYIPTANVFPSIGNDGASPIGGVKEGEIEINAWDNSFEVEPGYGTGGVSGTKMLRVQSVDYEFSFDREDLKQLYTGTYYKGLNEISVTATLNVLDSDLETWALTTGNLSDYTKSTLHTMSLSDFQAMDSLSLRIDVFNSKDYLLHTEGTLLKSITLLDGKVTSVGDARDVPGRGNQTFDIQFKRAHFTGAGQVGR